MSSSILKNKLACLDLMPMKGLQLDHLGFSIRGNTLFDDLCAQFAPGRIVALAGANGCGKSTLLRLLAGLNTPSQGKVLFNGQHVDHLSQKRQIGYVPNLPCLYNHLSVVENLIWLNRLRKASSPKAFATTLLLQHGLLEMKNKLFGQLSDGQKKRVTLLACLMHQPKLLLLDEPCSLLDPELREQLWAYLKSWQQPDRVILFSTHHVSEVDTFCDDIVFLHAGLLHFEKQSTTTKVPCV